jgi:hypothetical protein
MDKFTIIGTCMYGGHLYVTSEKANLELVCLVSLIVYNTSRFSIYKGHVECAYNDAPENLLLAVKRRLPQLEALNNDGGVLEIQIRINRLKEYIKIVEA